MSIKRSFVLVFSFLSLLVSLPAQAQRIIKLSDMDLSKAYQEYGGITVGKSVTNEPAVILEKTYTDVVG